MTRAATLLALAGLPGGCAATEPEGRMVGVDVAPDWTAPHSDAGGELARRPDLRAAESRLAAAELRAEAARRGGVPGAARGERSAGHGGAPRGRAHRREAARAALHKAELDVVEGS